MYYAILPQDDNNIVDTHYIWTKIKRKYANFKCNEQSSTSTSISLYETNMLKEEENDRRRSNDAI